MSFWDTPGDRPSNFKCSIPFSFGTVYSIGLTMDAYGITCLPFFPTWTVDALRDSIIGFDIRFHASLTIYGFENNFLFNFTL